MQLARAKGVQGILVSTQPNFAWVTGGLTNRIDGSRETGNGALLFGIDGRRFVVASSIEAPRLLSEVVHDLEFDSIEFPWTDERADPALPVRLASQAVRGPIGSDSPSAEAISLETPIAQLRAPLVSEEISRYRDLGRDVGIVIGEVARSTPAGTSELDAAASLAAALARAHLRPIVLLVAADDRIRNFRHPTPTDARWAERLMLVTCAERDGLVAAATRIVFRGPHDEELTRRTQAAASVFGALLETTVTAATGAQLFAAATKAYAAAGFRGEERRHHQGGAIGYRSRDWIAHPASDDVVTLPQAFAWNPSVTGTKVEETCIVHRDGEIEMLTTSPGWPSIGVQVRGRTIPVSDILTTAN